MIKKNRVSKNMTQGQLAQASYVSRPAIGSYEEGRAEPSIRVLIRIMAVLGFDSVDEFLGIKKQ